MIRASNAMSCYPCPMDALDLNLLATLDVLLSEGSVVGAAKRLQLSPSAMSRALARLRAATGDPLLVRAGRGLVPTPRALELKGRVRQVVDDAEAVLRPALKLDLATLSRTFTLRGTEGFAETFGAALVARAHAEAPSVRLSFLAKPDKDSTPLRDGTVDLETGVVADAMGPELRTQGLFRDRFVGVVRAGHPLLEGAMTPARYAAARHVAVERRGLRTALVDDALERAGLARDIAATVGGFGAAIAIARASDLVATVPEQHDAGLCAGMRTFALPLPVDEFTISLFWHPRMDADPAHRWLRGIVVEVCKRL
jgi:DNA-binding transcriptional LysR family regulator